MTRKNFLVAMSLFCFLVIFSAVVAQELKYLPPDEPFYDANGIYVASRNMGLSLNGKNIIGSHVNLYVINKKNGYEEVAWGGLFDTGMAVPSESSLRFYFMTWEKEDNYSSELMKNTELIIEYGKLTLVVPCQFSEDNSFRHATFELNTSALKSEATMKIKFRVLMGEKYEYYDLNYPYNPKKKLSYAEIFLYDANVHKDYLGFPFGFYMTDGTGVTSLLIRNTTIPEGIIHPTLPPGCVPPQTPK